jgi:hypothetical protein
MHVVKRDKLPAGQSIAGTLPVIVIVVAFREHACTVLYCIMMVQLCSITAKRRGGEMQGKAGTITIELCTMIAKALEGMQQLCKHIVFVWIEAWVQKFRSACDVSLLQVTRRNVEAAKVIVQQGVQLAHDGTQHQEGSVSGSPVKQLHASTPIKSSSSSSSSAHRPHLSAQGLGKRKEGQGPGEVEMMSAARSLGEEENEKDE